jgi:hypothetical protein|nr:MAG TPA: minor tail protein [Caudoviricetes sp.]
MAEAFELYASFKIDTSGYTQELNKIRQEMQQFQQELNSLAVHPTFDGGRFRAELQQAQQQSTQATEEIQRLQQQIQSLQQAADGNGGSGDSGGGVLSGFLSQLDVIGDIASGQFLANMAVNGINSIIDGITGSISESIGLASDLTETQNVVDVTFEDSADTINKWAQEALNAYGITETKAKQYTSTIGAMLKSMGIADDQVTQMSMDMAGLAADMASFYNLDHDTAFEKIRSGISGETEPLKSLGINMSVANLNAFALEKGMTKAFDKMSQAEQATLRYQYLLEATKDAQGDFARTGDSFSNEMRKLQTNLDRIKTEFGKGLLGVVTPAISLLNNVLSDKSYQYTTAEKIMQERDESIYDAKATYAQSLTIVNSMRNMEQESGEAVKATKAWQEALENLKNVMPGLSQYVDLTSDAIMGNTERIKQYVDTVNGVSLYGAHDTAVTDAQAAVDETEKQLESLYARRDYLNSLIVGSNAEEVKAAYQDAAESAYSSFVRTMSDISDYTFADTLEEFMREAPDGSSQYNDIIRARNGFYSDFHHTFNDVQENAWEMLAEAMNLQTFDTSGYATELENVNKEIEETNDELNENQTALARATAEWEAYKRAHPEVEEQVKFNKAVEDEKKALEDLKTALIDMDTYRADTLKKAQESYKGVASGRGYMVTHTQEEMKKLLDTDYSKENVLSWYGTNADALNAYNDAIKQAEASGVDVGILQQLTTYSKENDAYLSRLLNLTPEEIAQLNADYQRSREAEKSIAETATELSLATDEVYQAMREKVAELSKIYNQSDAITAAMAENKTAFLAGINLMKQTLEEEIPKINALLKSLGFDTEIGTKIPKYTTDSSIPTTETPYDYLGDISTGLGRAGIEYGGLAVGGHLDEYKTRTTPYDFLGDISTGKGRAADAPLAVGGHLMEYWAPNPKTNPQELADVLAVLEAKQEENRRAREGSGYWDKVQEAADKAYENRRQVAENLTFIREMHTTLETMQKNYLTALKERTAPNITNNENGVLWVRIENPADIATAVSGLPPTTIQNNFSVDGKMIATAIAPYVNSAIGGIIRSNLMFKKWGD